jgi:UBX domain-containing protein 1
MTDNVVYVTHTEYQIADEFGWVYVISAKKSQEKRTKNRNAKTAVGEGSFHYRFSPTCPVRSIQFARNMVDEQAVAQFITITGAPRGSALRFLDAANGDLEQAVESYFADNDAPQGAPPAPAPSAARAKKTARGGGIRSLGDLGAEDMEEEDDDDTNDYFAGGEKSGQLVRGAPKDRGDDVEGLFEKARQAGAIEGRPSDMQPHERGFQAFEGQPRTLAGGGVESPALAAGGAQEEHRHVTIAFYRNTIFTVDDGDPRRMDDPANMQFMKAIMEGRLPSELDPGDPNILMHVNLIRRDEEYEPPAQPKFKAFAGEGRKLCAPAGAGPSGIGSTQTAEQQSQQQAPAASSQGATWEGADHSKPRTSLQLRLADGSRVVADFNLEHTVGDIRRFIRAVRPDMPATYSLGTAFPPKQLQDDGVTLEAAGLANSVVIQKLT